MPWRELRLPWRELPGLRWPWRELGGNSRGLLVRRGPGLRPGWPRWPGRLPTPCCRGQGGSRGLGGGSSRADGPRCRAACSAPSQEQLLSSKRTRLQQGARRGVLVTQRFVCVAGGAGCGRGPCLRPAGLRVGPLQNGPGGRVSRRCAERDEPALAALLPVNRPDLFCFGSYFLLQHKRCH